MKQKVELYLTNALNNFQEPVKEKPGIRPTLPDRQQIRALSKVQSYKKYVSLKKRVYFVSRKKHKYD